MSRTAKTEYHAPDGFHTWHRLERQARPAGRDANLFHLDLSLDTDEVPQEGR